MKIKNRHGFTLVELLVVISIIALLVALLLPALNKARDQAKDALGLVNLRSIGQTLQLYTMDHNDMFSPTWFYDAGMGAIWNREPDKVMWQYTAQDYYQNPEILLCPKNTLPKFGPAGSFADDDRDPWGPERWMPKLPVLGNKYAEYGVARAGKPVSGYIVNDWLGSPGINDSGNHWKKIQSHDTTHIPMVLDGGWYSGQPSHFDIPPQDPLDKVQHDGKDAMDRFVFSRHRGGSQAVLMDMSVRRVSVKGLWKLKWHRQFDTTNNAATHPYYPWPTWIEELQQ